jgi:hypothetical protein
MRRVEMAQIPSNLLLFLLVAVVVIGYSRWLLATEHRVHRRTRRR